MNDKHRFSTSAAWSIVMFLCFIFPLLVGLQGDAWAQVSSNDPHPASTNYQLARRVLGMGGRLERSFTSNYQVLSTSGQTTGVGQIKSGNYTVNSGFWAGIVPALPESSYTIYLPLVVRLIDQ